VAVFGFNDRMLDTAACDVLDLQSDQCIVFASPVGQVVFYQVRDLAGKCEFRLAPLAVLKDHRIGRIAAVLDAGAAMGRLQGFAGADSTQTR